MATNNEILNQIDNIQDIAIENYNNKNSTGSGYSYAYRSNIAQNEIKTIKQDIQRRINARDSWNRLITPEGNYIAINNEITQLNKELDKWELADITYHTAAIKPLIISIINRIRNTLNSSTMTYDNYNFAKTAWDKLNSISSLTVGGLDLSNYIKEWINENIDINTLLSTRKPAETGEGINDTRLNYLQRQSQARKELPGSASQYYSNLAAAQKTKQTNKSATAFEE